MQNNEFLWKIVWEENKTCFVSVDNSHMPVSFFKTEVDGRYVYEVNKLPNYSCKWLEIASALFDYNIFLLKAANMASVVDTDTKPFIG